MDKVWSIHTMKYYSAILKGSKYQLAQHEWISK